MTLTSRVLIRALVVMLLALGGVCLLTYELVLVSGHDELDTILREQADVLAESMAQHSEAAAGLDGVLSVPETYNLAREALALHPSGPRHIAVVAVEGVRFQATGGEPEMAGIARDDEVAATRPGGFRTMESRAGALRVLDVAVEDPSGARLAVVGVVGSLADSRQAAVAALQRSALAGLVALGVGGVLLGLVVRRTLRPLHDVALVARRITPQELTARVPVPETRDEVAELARDINAMLERLDEADHLRRRYLAAVSHEVRTPLAVAEGHLELLTVGGEGDGVAATAEIVRIELDRLRRVLDDLLSIARGDDAVELRPGPVFLPDLADALSARVEALGLGRQVSVTEMPPVAFTGDQARIEQCITNLIHNAIDHNPQGTVVKVSGKGTGDSVSITVADDGSGIDPDLLPRVLEPFVTSRAGGPRRSSGLGLAIVDVLTRAQGGHLEIDTGAGGTTVTVTYPISGPQDPSTGTSSPSRSNTSS